MDSVDYIFMDAFFFLSTETKMHSVKVVSQVLFEHLNGDDSPGEQPSDSSKELLQRGKGGVRHMEESVIQGLLLITKNRNLKLMILDFSV